jgi:hypothetical protein
MASSLPSWPPGGHDLYRPFKFPASAAAQPVATARGLGV